MGSYSRTTFEYTLYGQISALRFTRVSCLAWCDGHTKASRFPKYKAHARSSPLDVGVWLWMVVSVAMQLSVTFAPVALNGFGWMLLLLQFRSKEYYSKHDSHVLYLHGCMRLHESLPHASIALSA